MAYYSVVDIVDAMNGFSNKITVLCSLYNTLDYWRRIVLIMYLAEYIIVKSRNDSQIRGDSYYIRHDDVVKSYCGDMKEAVNTVLRARDLTCHAPDTTAQRRVWKKVWEDGHVEKLLKYEGFL